MLQSKGKIIFICEFCFVAIIERSKSNILQRYYRYIYLNVDHIGQNLYLIVKALVLGACTIGAIYDDEINDLFGMKMK